MIRMSLLVVVVTITGVPALEASECGKYLDISDERYSGTVKSINQDGDGIVSAPSRDYPLLAGDLEKAGIDRHALAAGARVSFQVQFDKICRAYSAINLKLE